MLISLHKKATTKPKIRAAIQENTELAWMVLGQVYEARFSQTQLEPKIPKPPSSSGTVRGLRLTARSS
jgi:hypothetical protein